MHNIFADPKTRDAKELLEKMSYQIQQGNTSRQDRWSTCLYCEGKKFVQVPITVYADSDKFIPIEIEHIPVANAGTVAIECDCHPHRPGKFASIFGVSVKDSHLGAAIRREHERKAAGLTPGYDEEEVYPF